LVVCDAFLLIILLSYMAISYMKFVQSYLIQNQKVRVAVVKIGEVMNAHPEIIASHQFVCTALLEDDNILAKGGAQGVYCFTLKKERLSIALKVLTGSELVWPNILADLLETLHYSNIDTIKHLRKIRGKAILNDSGEPIGETKTNLS